MKYSSAFLPAAPVALSPETLARLTTSAFTMLLEGEDETQGGDDWEMVAGNRIVLSSFDEGPMYPVAVVAEDRAGDSAILTQIAQHSADDPDLISVQVGARRPTGLVMSGRRISLWDISVFVIRLIAVYVVLRMVSYLEPQAG